MSNENNNQIAGVKDGEVFRLGGTEFIKFPDVNGETPVLMKNIAFRSEFGKNNDLRCSTALRRMEQEILPKIIAAVGEENVCTVKTDLTTLDGLKTYGVMESKISLPTLDFYRANVQILDRYKPSDWWWLATADSTKPHYDPIWTVCVSPAGCIYDYYYYFQFGVRPFCILKSSIFESFAE